MRFSNHGIYKSLKKWFLGEIVSLRNSFYQSIREVASRYGISVGSVFLMLRDSKTWPRLSPDIYRALTLIQEIILWTRVPSIKDTSFDVSKVSPIIMELGMKLHLSLFSNMEKKWEKKVEDLSLKDGISFLDVMEIFERGLSQDRFAKKDIVLGILASQFRQFNF
jgi:hypothetical protein